MIGCLFDASLFFRKINGALSMISVKMESMAVLVQWKKWISGPWTTVWLSVALMRAVQSGASSFRLSDGSVPEGKVDAAWFATGTLPHPMVKTRRLKSAYKQLALNDLEARKSVICLKCPNDGQVYGFACKTLPAVHQCYTSGSQGFFEQCS